MMELTSSCKPLKLLLFSVLVIDLNFRLPVDTATADDNWTPFAEQDRRDAELKKKKRRLRRSGLQPPLNGARRYQRNSRPSLTGRDTIVESVDLAPLPGAATRSIPQNETSQFEQRQRFQNQARINQPPNRNGTTETFRNNPAYGAANRADRDERQGLPGDIWRGLNSKQVEGLVAGLKIPPRSPILHSLWRRLWLSKSEPENTSNSDGNGSYAGRSAPPRHGEAGNHHIALSLEALYRSGLVGDVTDILSQRGDRTSPLLATLQARALIGLGKRSEACDIVKRSVKPNAAMPNHLKGQALLVMGYCAAATNNAAAAGLAVDLAREEGIKSPLAFAVMNSVANATKPRLDVPDRMTLLDLRFLQLASSADPSSTLDNAEPAVLGALALDGKAKPALRMAAAERGVKVNAVSDQTLAQVYRAQRFNRADIADPLPTRSNPAKRRALLFQAIERARDPLRQAQFIQAFYKLAKRDRLHFTASKMLLRALTSLPVERLEWFMETATDIAVTGGDYALARRWAAPGDGRQLAHWMALIDIADPAKGQNSGYSRGADLTALDNLARQKRFNADDLHRLATVLDALAYNVPIPLWEAASRTPQPTNGYLPKTGILPQLSTAASGHEIGRTALLAIRTIGPKGATGAHMIALGDTIRALRLVGLETEARRLAFEALIDNWPHNKRLR